jgi:hypothetical protein
MRAGSAVWLTPNEGVAPDKNAAVAAGSASSGGPLLWDASSLGPNCELRKGGAGVTRTSSDSWGIQCGDTWLIFLLFFLS